MLAYANPTHLWIFQAGMRQLIPTRKDGVFLVAYGMWGMAAPWCILD